MLPLLASICQLDLYVAAQADGLIILGDLEDRRPGKIRVGQK